MLEWKGQGKLEVVGWVLEPFRILQYGPGREREGHLPSSWNGRGTLRRGERHNAQGSRRSLAADPWNPARRSGRFQNSVEGFVRQCSADTEMIRIRADMQGQQCLADGKDAVGHSGRDAACCFRILKQSQRLARVQSALAHAAFRTHTIPTKRCNATELVGLFVSRSSETKPGRKVGHSVQYCCCRQLCIYHWR